MLLQELLKNLQDIELQQEELKRQKKKLIIKAKQERVLEIGVLDLYNELLNITDCKKGKIRINTISVPEKLNKDINKVKEYILENNIGFGVIIELYTDYDTIVVYKFTTSIADARLKNGERLIDNLSFKNKTQLCTTDEIIKDIVVNFSLDNSLLQKEYFKQAVLNCVIKRETQK